MGTMSDDEGQTAPLHLRWLANGKVIACGAGTGELAPKASAVTCQECRATLPWLWSALIEPFEELAAVYRRIGEGMARALGLMPEPETRRTAEQILRDFKPGEGLTGLTFKPVLPSPLEPFGFSWCRNCGRPCVGQCVECRPSPAREITTRASNKETR
jgi:hypothetical protein